VAVGGIRTNAAAELLGVSVNTLRSWERRFGFPVPRRTAGGHRQYELEELEALRRALVQTDSISAAVELVRRRGAGPSSAEGLVDAWERFDEPAADRHMEESLAVRSLERSVEELLLPALEALRAREGRDAELDFGCRWATGWLHAARRLAAPATRPHGILLFEAAARLGVETVQVQALELALRRAGFPVLLLSAGLAQERLTRALRALAPAACVVCGPEATLDAVGRLAYVLRQLRSGAHVLDYRDAMPVTGRHRVPSLGARPAEAVEALRSLLEGPAPAAPVAYLGSSFGA
jgi:DNA-binding transcriptional MerR regulator